MALQFSGTQYLSRSGAILTAPPMTFACWYNPQTLSSDQCQISIGSSTVSDFFAIFHTTLFNQQRSETEHNAVGQSAIRNNILRVGTWYNIVGVITSSTSRQIYINAIAGTPNVTSSLPVNLDTTAIGALFKSGPINLCKSKIAFPTIWNIALGTDDVASLYNLGVGADPRTIQTGNLISFSLLSGSPYLDSIAGFNWSVTGTPVVVGDPFTLTGLGGVAIPPTISVQPADAISSTIATFHGTVSDTGGADPQLTGFNYGTSIAYGQTASVAGDFSTGPFSQMITGLLPATDYHYRAFGANIAGTGRSGDSAFTTQAVGGGPPITYIQSNVAVSAVATSSLDCTYSGTQTAGNTNVVFTYSTTPGAGKYPNFLTDIAGNDYINVGFTADSGQHQISVWQATNIVGSLSNVVTADLPNFANCTLIVVEYSGASTTFPVAGWTFNMGTGTSATLPITNPNPFEMVVTVVHEISAGTMTPSGGLTTRLTSATVQLMDIRYLDAGPQIPTVSVANGLWVMIGVGLNPAGAVNLPAGPFTKGEVLFDGTQIGTVGHDANSTTKANLTDAYCFTVWNVDTVGCWAGIDCGVPTRLTRVRITAKGGHEDSSIGCQIQGSSDPTFFSGNILYLVPSRPVSGTLLNEYEIEFPSTITYRYYRFHSLNKTLFLADLDFIGTYTAGVVAQGATPVISPPGGHFYAPVKVSITTLTTDADIHYTLDGSTPDVSSALYTGPIIVSARAQLNAVAVSPFLTNSRTATAYFYMPPEFNSGVFRYDDRNYRLTSRSGTIMQDPVSGFWYNYMENLDAFGYRTNGYQGFNVYRSADLMNWVYVGCICGPSPGTATGINTNALFRPTVFYNASTQLYVLWATPSNGARGMCVFTSQFADGSVPWTQVTAFTSSLGGNSGTFGDLGGFVDDNGTDAYIIFNYSNNSRVCYAQLNDDYLDINTGNMATYVSNGEAWTEFKRNGVYFMFLSGQTGINLNANTYQTSTTPIGPWVAAAATPFQVVSGVGANSPANSYLSQVDNVIHISGRGDCYIFGGDRLSMNNLGTVSEGLDTKVFVPMIFSSDHIFSVTYRQGTWFDGTFSSPFLLDAIFPTISGTPVPASNLALIGSGTVVSWSNNEQMASNLYIEGASDAAFTANVVSEIVPSGDNSFNITQFRNFYRLRSVNANGFSFSTFIFSGLGGTGSGNNRLLTFADLLNMMFTVIRDTFPDIDANIAGNVASPSFLNYGIPGDTHIPREFQYEYEKLYKLATYGYRV